MIPICLWDYIHHVRYYSKAYFFVPLIHYLLWLPGRNVGKVILFILDAMPFFLAPQVEIQHGCFVSEDFCTMNGQKVRAPVLMLKKGKHKTWHSMHFPYNPINFATCPFWHCPHFTHPTHAPLKQSYQVRHQSKGKLTGFPCRDIYLMITNSG